MFVLLILNFIRNLLFGVFLDPRKGNCSAVKALAPLFEKVYCTVVAEGTEDMKLQDLTPDDDCKDGICVSM